MNTSVYTTKISAHAYAITHTEMPPYIFSDRILRRILGIFAVRLAEYLSMFRLLQRYNDKYQEGKTRDSVSLSGDLRLQPDKSSNDALLIKRR
jgi:hypothetical protein